MAATFDRYIFREMVPPFFLSATVLLLVMILQKLFRIADLVVSKGATLASTAQVLLFVMPGFLVITLPMSLLVASLTAFSRMSSDSEITAMKASRISVYRMIRPVFVFALLTFGATAFVSLTLMPIANTALKAYLFNVIKTRATLGLEEGVFSSAFDGMVIYVDKIDPKNGMHGVFISDERASEPYTVTAKRGTLSADPQSLNVTLTLQDGSIHSPPRDDGSYSLMNFATAHIYLDIRNSLSGRETPGKDVQDMTGAELLRDIRNARAAGRPAFKEETELNKRLSIPYACFIFGLIGAPLGIRKTRSGKSAGLAIALLVFLAYYIVLGGATNLAETGTVPALRAYWLPNIVMTLLAFLFVYLKGQEIELGVGNALAVSWYRMKARMTRFLGIGKRRLP